MCGGYEYAFDDLIIYVATLSCRFASPKWWIKCDKKGILKSSKTEKRCIAMMFAEKLQKLRKQNGLSQEQLAEKLFVSRQAVSKWEMGTIPDMENMVKIAKYFDCSLDYLLNDEDADCKRNEDIQCANIGRKNIIQKVVSISSVTIGVILCLLMPLFARLYQAFEFANEHQCLTNAFDYIWRFPLLGVLLIAIIFIGVGITLLYLTFRKR